MKVVNPLNERKINHLIRALELSGFFSKSKDKGGKPSINKIFLERVKSFVSSAGGKKARTVINAFRTIDPISFENVPRGQDFIDERVREALTIFFTKALESKKCIWAVKITGLESKRNNGIIKKIIKEEVSSQETKEPIGILGTHVKSRELRDIIPDEAIRRYPGARYWVGASHPR